MESRRSNLDINTARSINSSRFDLTGAGIDSTDRSIFIDKPFEKNRQKNNSATSSITRSPKKISHKLKANPQIFEMERLMAYSEVKYREDINRVQKIIAKNKAISNLSIACLMYGIHYLIGPWKIIIKKIYFFRWIAKVKSVNKKQRRLIRRIETRRHRAVKLMDKLCKRTLVFGLYTFKERSLACYLARINEYQTGARSPEISYSRNSLELSKSYKSKSPVVKITSSLYKQPSKVKNLDEETKREYKASIKSRYQKPVKFVEKAMGLSYYR